MSKLTMPYQRLHRSNDMLIAARGSSIDSFSLKDGSLLSTWTDAFSSKPEPPVSMSASSPPAKRRKISAEETGEGKDLPKEEPKEEPVKSRNGSNQPKKEKKKQNNRSDAVASGLQHPAIIALTVSQDGKYIVAVTAEDKSVRVFENLLSEGGKQELVLLTVRQMPKRPCAVILTSDCQTIISADKFGDVYSLPLIPPPESSNPTPLPSTPEADATPKVHMHIPAANELTIHSQRNLQALANQRRGGNPAPEVRTFAGTLMLGHVSMLTDIIMARDGEREYILTADRDEHIRITRGLPQTHVIEGFCLGHEQFITRLCIPNSRTNTLISGGGDDEIYIWEWLSGTLISKIDLKSYVAAIAGSEEINIVVSGILHTQVPGRGDGVMDLVIITCEAIPVLFTFILTSDPHTTLSHHQTIPLKGNILDMTLHTSLIVSIDTIHTPGSTTARRESTSTAVKPFQVFDWQKDAGQLVENSSFEFAAGGEGEQGIDVADGGSLGNLLYTLEGLRKREGEDKEE